jgi:5'(3')-deoxyribonucleotidase
MHKPRVLLDCDGVLADFLTPAFAILNRLSGLNRKMDELKEWDIFSLFSRTYEDQFYQECSQPGFCVGLQVLPGMVEFVEKLHEIANVYVVTSSMNVKIKGPEKRPAWHKTWAHEREHWLEEHFGILPKRVIHTSEKYVCIGDVLIDDKPQNIVEWERAHGPKGIGLLWGTSYNQTSKAGRRVPTPKFALAFVKNLRT